MRNWQTLNSLPISKADLGICNLKVQKGTQLFLLMFFSSPPTRLHQDHECANHYTWQAVANNMVPFVRHLPVHENDCFYWPNTISKPKGIYPASHCNALMCHYSSGLFAYAVSYIILLVPARRNHVTLMVTSHDTVAGTCFMRKTILLSCSFLLFC